MPPKGSGARCRINVDKAERGGAVIFQVRLRAAGVPTVKGPPRESLAAAAADKACLLRVPETGRHAELRRLKAEHAQSTGEGPQTPRRQQGSPPRRRVTGKRGPSPRRSPAPRAAAGTPASGPKGGLRTPSASARRPRQSPGAGSLRGPTPRTAGGRRDLAAATFRDVLTWHDDHGRWPRRCTSQKGPEAVLAQRWHRWGKSTKLTPAAQNVKARIDATIQAERESRREDGRAEGAEQALLTRHQHWCEGNDVHDEDRWRLPALHRSRGGQHPYPSFSNLCNTCYLNAPLQCLLHCPAARAALLGAGCEGEPLIVQDAG